MIIKSKFKTLGFWLSLIATLVGLILIIYISLNGINNSPKSAVIALLFLSVLLTVIYGKLLWDSNFIRIDQELKTIIFKNRFTLASSVYHFFDIDSTVVAMEPIKGGYSRNLYFVKNGRFIKRISSFIYSNQKELEEALAEIKSLGEIEYSYINSLKILLGFKILE